MIVADGLGYAAWRDGGFTILDIADPGNIKLVSHVNTSPPFAGGTHTPLPLPGRKLAVMLEESNGFACSKGLSYTWLYDVSRSGKPDFDCDAANADGSVMVPARREFWTA